MHSVKELDSVFQIIILSLQRTNLILWLVSTVQVEKPQHQLIYQAKQLA